MRLIVTSPTGLVVRGQRLQNGEEFYLDSVSQARILKVVGKAKDAPAFDPNSFPSTVVAPESPGPVATTEQHHAEAVVASVPKLEIDQSQLTAQASEKELEPEPEHEVVLPRGRRYGRRDLSSQQ